MGPLPLCHLGACTDQRMTAQTRLTQVYWPCHVASNCEIIVSNKQIALFEGMAFIKAHYTESKMRDSEFADRMTEELKRLTTTAQVRQWRASLGIPNNAPRDPFDGRVKQIAELADGLRVRLLTAIAQEQGVTMDHTAYREALEIVERVAELCK